MRRELTNLEIWPAIFAGGSQEALLFLTGHAANETEAPGPRELSINVAGFAVVGKQLAIDLRLPTGDDTTARAAQAILIKP